ncbi:MAG: insulinase family protein [Bacteroidaceae bacterium]|nr:insulinase family protein [Bacteroidaceae bacterium]
MKSEFKRAFMPLLLLLCVAIQAVAQKGIEQLPIDPSVRMGKLKNGLTYYIKHNEEPKKKVNFYIAQKVGSIQEEDNQRGLAHFLEHMCFNGTEHFPGKSLINYLETIGVKFGVNLNAYTSIEETVYNINDVPVDSAGAVDSCLWILRDWADGLTLDGEEIDKERGVIHEEWRQRSNATSRMFDQVLPIVYQGEKYAYRMPIGTMEIIDSFPHKALRDYYEKWYRPDLQGIIVVGDVDVDNVEKKIKKIFKGIKKAKNPAERVYYPVSDNEGLIFAQGTDKEQQNYAFQLIFKRDATPRELRNTKEYKRNDSKMAMMTSMLNTRFTEIAMKENPPYLGAGVDDDDFIVANTKKGFMFALSCKVERINEALPSALCEFERAKRFGFTEGELQRVKASMNAAIDKAFAERDKMSNAQRAQDYIRNFLDNTSAMSVEEECTLLKEIVESITLEEVNALLPALCTKDNRVAISLAPANDSIKYPVKEQIEMLLAAVEQAPLQPYVDSMNDAPLLENIPDGGKIISTEEGVWGSTVWNLANGIKVIVKPTDFAADKVLLNGYSYGGTGRYAHNERVNLLLIGPVMQLGGAGAFDAMQLNKKMAGSTAVAGVSTSTYHDKVSATCSPKDLEDMFKLLYLKFTAPRKDEAALEGFKTRMYGSLKDRDMNPMTAISDSVNKAMFNGHPRMEPLRAADVDSISYDRIMEIYNDRFGDAGDFTFVIVGNIESDKLQPLVEKYIGGLPANGRKEVPVDHNVNIRKGKFINNFTRKMETPAGTEVIIYSGDIEANLRNSILMSYLQQVMTLVYTTEVREKEGGTYGVGVRGSIDRLPKGEFFFNIEFNMAPERREELTDIIIAELEKVAKEGPSPEYVEKVRSYMLKTFDDEGRENSAWSNWLLTYYFYGEDYYTEYKNIVNSITPDDIRLFLDYIIGQGNFIEVSMVPEK